MPKDRVMELITDYFNREPREKLDPKMDVIRAFLSRELGIDENLIKGSHVVHFVTEAPEWALKEMLRKTRNVGVKTLEKIRLTGRGTDSPPK